MTPALRILAPGLFATIQDLGRAGYQRLGVPVAGALDAVSLRAANLLAGNEAGAGAIECAYLGPTFVVEADSVRLGLAGASATIEVLADETAVAGRRVAGPRSLNLRRGEVVRIGAIAGPAFYIAVEGGFDIAPVLGSVATSLRSGFGGVGGRALKAGDRVPLRLAAVAERSDLRIDLDGPPRRAIRVIRGAQADHFSEDAIATFLAGEYKVAAGSDRMGMRLDGPKIGHRDGFNIVSDAVAPGAIQIPGDGTPIVLLADRQTTGGYPKIANVISADLPALGRLAPGDTLRFEETTLEAATEARRKALAEIEALPARISPLTLSGAELAAALHRANLISGVVDAAA